MQDQWLIQKRPRWQTRIFESRDVCFLELHQATLPSGTANGGSYCVFAFATCPGENFELLGASLYMNTVICCTKIGSSPETAQQPSAPRPLHALVTLGHPTEADKQFLRQNLGAKVMANGTNDETGCPRMDGGLKLNRRVAHSNPITDSVSIRALFNLTAAITEQQFLERTGIWVADNMVHLIYCEYTSQHKGRVDKSKKEWPLANFAIPKSMVPCPNNSEHVLFSHNQHHHGFHYSRPIHLDGMYLQGEKYTVLAYCVFTSETERRSVYDDDMRGELPAGHYCVLQVHGSCPVGFESGLLSVVEGQESTISKTTQDSTKDFSYNPGTHGALNIDRVHIQPSDSVKISRVDYRFCCRADSVSVDNPIQGFPTNTGPFYLYRVGDKCQLVEGMRVSDEHICMDAPNKAEVDWRGLEQNYSWTPYSISGLTPARIPFHTNCDVEINLCYYEPDVSHPTELTYEIHNNGDWPQGQYALPNVHRPDSQVACPPGFTYQHLSLLHRIPFLEIDIIPPSMGQYFLEMLGHNSSVFNVHYCLRDQPEGGEINKTYDEQAFQWPRGDYCVISASVTNSCPPGLHRHTRSIAELCCRNDNLENPPEVEWPFVEDFFMFGVPRCLPIKDTHVERYLVRLVPLSEAKIGKDWDIMCHYMPLSWLTSAMQWPPGNYMLPIGHRGGLKIAMVNTVDYSDTLTPDRLPFQESQAANRSNEDAGGHPRYRCPETFQRARFTFVSKSTERERGRPRLDDRMEDYHVVSTTAMEFCVRENFTEETESTEKWPAGDYCVFTMNADCPVEMQASESMPLVVPRFVLKSIDLVDEFGDRIANHHWHEDVDTQVVHFMQCCRTDRNLMLRLPVSDDGFYVKSSNGLCSRVPGTVLDREKVTSYLSSPLTSMPLSEEPSAMVYRELIAQQAGVMYLCYYHPVSQLDNAFAIAAEQLATTFNVTERDLVKIASMCGCAENAFCLPHKGAECVCNLGYFGDGRHLCRPITPLTDECANMCDPAATCSEPLEGVFRRKKEIQLWSHACICRPGYVGDGFTCQPSCAAHVCQQFSRCVHNVVKNTISCECIEGTVQSEGRCNLDMYKSIQHEKDLPQFLIHYDHCLSEETQNALRLLQPNRYFYLFVPSELIKTCQDMAAHLVVLKQKLTERQLLAATALTPIRLVTENNTVIEVYPENNTWSIDGNLAKRNPTLFVNGELYLLTAPLKRTANQPSQVGYYIVGVVVSIFTLALICGVIFMAVTRREKIRSTFVPLRNRLLSRRRGWHKSGGSILIEYTEGNDEEQEQ